MHTHKKNLTHAMSKVAENSYDWKVKHAIPCRDGAAHKECALHTAYCGFHRVPPFARDASVFKALVSAISALIRATDSASSAPS